MSTLQTVAKGALGASLLRNSKQIKEERGFNIWNETERTYRRKVEDLQYKIDRLKQQQAGLLDLSPENSQSLILAKDFDPEKFFAADNDFTMQIRTAKIELEEASERYKQLFTDQSAEEVTQNP